MILPDPLTGRAMARGVRSVGVALGSAWWLSSLNAMLTGPRTQALPFVVGSLVALGIPLVWAFRSMRGLDGPVAELQVFVLVGLVVRLVEPFVVSQPTGSLDYSPLNPVLTATAALATIVVMPRVGIPVIVISGAVIASQRVAVVGAAQAITEGVDFIVADLVMMVVIWAVRAEADRRAMSTAAALDAGTRAASARHRAALRERLDGLVHDKVLAALMLASRGQVDEAAGLAREALAELDPTPTPRTSPDSLAVIGEHAELLGIDLTIVGDVWAPGAEGDALRAATCEALTNVRRHSGQSRAVVRTSRHGDRYLVEVTDDGVGFDVTAVRHDRLGVRQRIVGGVTAVGGQARVDSRVGAGTTIVMSATVSDEAATRGRSWRPATMVWAIPLAAVSLLAHMVIGALHLGHVVNRGIVWGSFVVLPVLGVLVTAVRKHGPRWYAVLAVSVLVWAALLMNVADPSISDWRTWFIGSLSGLAAIVAWRRGTVQALAVIVLGTGLGILGLELRGETSWTPVLLATVQGLIYAPAVGVIKSVIDRAGRATAVQQRLTQEAAVETSLATTLDEQITARREAMEVDVVPALRRIARGAVLSTDDRARCRDLEAATRDQLVAASLLAPELVEAIAAARARGSRVNITGTASADDGLARLRAASVAVLGVARAGDRVTVRASSEGAVTHGTAVLVGPGVAGLTLPPLPPSCVVEESSQDPDSVVLSI